MELKRVYETGGTNDCRWRTRHWRLSRERRLLRQARLCARGGRRALLGPAARPLREGNAAPARRFRGRCLRVVVLSEQASDGEARLRKVTDEEVEVSGALQGAPVRDLQVQPVELHPRGSRAVRLVRVEAQATLLLLLGPLPSDVQASEIHVRARRTIMTRLRLNKQQHMLGGCLPRNLEQSVPARLHQIEPLAVYVLHVGIANSLRRRRCWRRRRRRAGRRLPNSVANSITEIVFETLAPSDTRVFGADDSTVIVA